jgi:hypothetical protein
MPRKTTAQSTSVTPNSAKAIETRSAKSVAPKAAPLKGSATIAGVDDLARLALKACLIARDAAFNVHDLLTNSSRMAFLSIKDCEKELDVIERQIDERLPAAITRVSGPVSCSPF